MERSIKGNGRLVSNPVREPLIYIAVYLTSWLVEGQALSVCLLLAFHLENMNECLLRARCQE